MAYLKYWGAFAFIFLALCFAVWALRLAVRRYFDEEDFQNRFDRRMREIDEEMEKQDAMDSN